MNAGEADDDRSGAEPIGEATNSYGRLVGTAEPAEQERQNLAAASRRTRPLEPLVAGVELGGTKSFVVLAQGSVLLERVRVRTVDPVSTLRALSDQLTEWRNGGDAFAAIGVASFGPLGLDTHRHDFGFVTTTPKFGWANVDVRGHFADRFDVPVGFDTDVAGAALAEGRWGAAQDCAVHVYITIGTGIGAGVVVDGRPVHGLVHPELGHLRVRRAHPEFAGICPFHADCIEGLASGPAITARAGKSVESLGPDHPVWSEVAADIAEVTAMLTLVLSPQRIMFGGGVGLAGSFPLTCIRTKTLALLGGYVAALDATRIEELVAPPGLGNDAGPLGAAALALNALDGGRPDS